jgi:hypothetical protein
MNIQTELTIDINLSAYRILLNNLRNNGSGGVGVENLQLFLLIGFLPLFLLISCRID